MHTLGNRERPIPRGHIRVWQSAVLAAALLTAALAISPCRQHHAVLAGLAWVIPPGRAELLFLLMYLADVPGRLLVRRRERQIPGWPHNASTDG